MAVVTVLPPFGGVGVDIVPDAEIVGLAADDMVVVALLPQDIPSSFRSRAFELVDNLRERRGGLWPPAF